MPIDTHASSRQSNLVGGKLNINSLLAFMFGVIFLSVMLLFSVWFPNPSDFQIKVFITCLALSAAGVGAILPGLFEIKYKSVARATGAAAFFLVVYATQPVLERHIANFVPADGDPTIPATMFLKLIDDGELQKAYALLDVDAQKYWGGLPTFLSLYENSKSLIGRAESRVLVGTDVIVNPPNYPLGSYRLLTYRSRFAGGCRSELVGLRAGQDLAWHIWSHIVSPTTIPCS